MSLKSRFNTECTAILKLISSVVQFGPNFEAAVRELASIAPLDADLCVAGGRIVMLHKDSYKLPDTKASIHPSLQSITSKMVRLNTAQCTKIFILCLSSC